MLPLMKGRDLLLNGARILVWGIFGLLIFGVVMVGVGLITMLTVNRTELLTQMASAGFGVTGFGLSFTGAALVGCLLVLAMMFALNLLRIIDSVELGDPFVPINADRLRAMGWFTVAGQGILLAITAIALWFGGAEQKQVALDARNMLFSSLILALVLFILARVFRLGTQMRDELEGTV